jgi:hypothetical protein
VDTRPSFLPPPACLQNKRKMTLEDFARMNKDTNEGEPMPRELLTTLYGAIARDELRISGEGLLARPPPPGRGHLRFQAGSSRGARE